MDVSLGGPGELTGRLPNTTAGGTVMLGRIVKEEEVR